MQYDNSMFRCTHLKMLEASSEVLHIFLDAGCQIRISTGYKQSTHITDVSCVLSLQQLCTHSIIIIIWFIMMMGFNPMFPILCITVTVNH